MSSAVVFCGTFVHSTEEEPMVIKKSEVIGVQDEKIIFISKKENLHSLLQKHHISEDCVIYLHEHQFLIPGFIDTHIHASQYPNAGKGLDCELLEWLEKYTFPTEAKFHDTGYSRDVYTKVVNRTLSLGTTTACYFSTLHHKSANVLCDVIEKAGQRALVGKVNADRNSPDYYIEDTDTSVKDTEKFIDDVKARENCLLTPVITPRFAVACSMKLMTKLGEIAKKYDIPIQTHLSENIKECEMVKELFPDCDSYTEVYNKAGLLTDKTILAHCIYLSESELKIISARGAGISHCPNSNMSIHSGLLDVRKLLSYGIKVGLGTDVSGGYSPSMLDAIRTALHVSNIITIQNQNYKPITHKEAFMLATFGGSKVLDIEKVTGNFEVGKDFDALVIDLSVPGSMVHVFEEDTVDDFIQKFLYLGDDRNITEVYVAGRKVA